MTISIDRRRNDLLRGAMEAHSLTPIPNDPAERLLVLGQHATQGCTCDRGRLREALAALRLKEVPLPRAEIGSFAVALREASTDDPVYVTSTAVRVAFDTWEMPDPLTAGLIAFVLEPAPTEVDITTGRADIIASLLFGWKGGRNNEVFFDDEEWDGPFPGKELLEAYEISSYSFEGDDSSPLTSGDGGVALVELAGWFWACIWNDDDFAGDWRLLSATTTEEAKAIFTRGYTTGS